MKTLNIYLILCILSLAGSPLFAQSADITQDPFSNETDVRSNTNQIIVTLTNDTLLADVGTDDVEAASFLAGFSGGSSAWDNIIAGLNAGNIELTGAGTVATITIPAQGNYYIDADESITLTIPAGSLKSGGPAISATGSISISDQDPVISITTETYLETDIRAGTIQFDITLAGDEWENTLTATFRDSIDSDGSGWDAQIRPNLTVNRISSTTVQVTIPQTPAFDITSNENVTIEVSAANLQHTGTGVFVVSGQKDIDRVAPYLTLTSVPAQLTEQNIAGDAAVIKVKLYEVTVSPGPPFSRGNFVLSTTPTDMTSGNNLEIASNGDITSPAADEFEIVLTWDEVSGDIDEEHFLSLTINAAEVSGSENISSIGSVSILSNIVPNITDVTVPIQPYGIGNVISAIVTVDPDGGGNFVLEGGSIAGRAVNSISRENSTTYRANVNIIENSNPQYTSGQSYDVTNLQFSNAGENGNSFSKTITQGGDPIDSERPIVSLISIDNGTYKIGDDITVIVDAGEPGIGFDSFSTRINGERLNQSNVSFSEVGSGFYQFTYTVEEGDDDISGTIPVIMVAEDLVGNESNPYSTVSGLPSVIDGNSPNILSVDEPSVGQVAIPGDPVQLVVSTTESGLTLGSGTVINGETPSGFTPSGSTYTITYIVGADDDEVSSGNLTATIILVDAAGNSTTQVNGITNNDIEIVTSEPYATISGGGEMCAGQTATIYINPSGQAPFSITVLENGALYDGYTGVSGPFSIDVSPSANADYTISQITDGLGISGSAEGTATVVVNPIPDVSITSPPAGAYDIPRGTPIDLTGEPEGGIFSGPGVESPANKFHPDIAEPEPPASGDSLYKILYTYTESSTGCVGKDSIEVNVVDELLLINDLPSVLCWNEDPITITGTNLINGGIGYFRLYDSRDIKRQFPLPALSDFGNNSALISPETLTDGTYIVRFSYRLIIVIPLFPSIEYTYFTEETFTHDRFNPARIRTKGLEPTYCSNDDQVVLEGNLDDRLDGDHYFSGPGIGLDGEDYILNPDTATLGNGIIKYLYVSDNGCRDSAFHLLEIFDVPELAFTAQDTCMPLEGGFIQFENETDTFDVSVTNWKWEFIEGGITTTYESSFYEDLVQHKFDSAATSLVRLSIISEDGCAETLTESVPFADEPKSRFRWITDCYSAGTATQFVNESSTRIDNPFEDFVWHISGDIDDTTFISVPAADTVEFLFDRSGNYFIELLAMNERGCIDTSRATLAFKQSVEFADADGRYMDFNINNEFWTAISRFDDSTSAWTWGSPDFSGFEPAPEDDAWYTNLKEDVAENSWIQSQCFDMRELERPMIRMDVMRSFDFNRDGAVLQYTTDNGDSWTTVGNIGEGINWYNSFNIKEEPGGGRADDGSPIGWSGEDVFDPDSTWVTVAHDLDQLIGEDLVIFGIFYATDGASVVDNQGFAVDNIYIGERTKMALVEHFTNAGDSDATDADGEINDFVEENNLDVASLQYHMHYPFEDPMNLYNPAPSASRSFYYGVTEVPFAYLDGGLSEAFVYDFDPGMPTENQLKTLTLESPLFDLELSYQVSINNNRISPKVRFEALQDIDSLETVLNIAIIEKTVEYTGGAGTSEFSNVVRNMLPTAAGTVYARAWERYDFEAETFHWYYDEEIDPAELAVVAFLQDGVTGKVLQVAKAETPEFPLPAYSKKIPGLKIYPNPAKTFLIIEDERLLQPGHVFELVDMTGRVILLEDTQSISHRIIIDIQSLHEGTYFIQMKRDGTIRGRELFVKTH